MAAQAQAFRNTGPAGDGEYIVAAGDCIESIAAGAGLLWETIWNDPQNASLKKVRGNPNILLPGDRLHVREREEKTVERPVDQRHKFVRKGAPSKLRLCVKRAGQPRGQKPYQLVVDGEIFTGTTDNDGWLEVVIRPDARDGRLTVGDDPLHQQVFSLELGGMDPITEPTGIQKRLRNLGYDCEPTGELDEETRAVIAMFQKSEDLEETGEPDAATLDRLQQRYKS